MSVHARVTRGSLLLLLLAGWSLPIWEGYAHSEKLSASEHQIKAAFLYNFVQFIEWPASAFKDAHSDFSLCVLGDDPFGTALERTIGGKIVKGRRLAVKRSGRLHDLTDCQLMFISSSERDHLTKTLDLLAGSSVLTVGDTDQFAHLGGMINLYVEENKVRFEINPQAAERSGLKISSKLLKLAKTVPGTSGK
ncbi:MAG: YfiR family protein [Nitrospirales bacterium]|nr:YfiR family protein [Nitrospirales bacterium]